MNGDSRARGTERTEVERSGVFERARQKRGGWQSVWERETRAGRVPCTVCHLAISWPTTRSQHEAFYEWAEAIIEALDWMKTLPMSSPCIPPTASARRQWRSSVATLEVANACAVIFFLFLSNVLSTRCTRLLPRCGKFFCPITIPGVRCAVPRVIDRI